MSTMTMSAETNMRDQDSDSSWYGYDLELRTPPPMSSNGSMSSNGNGMLNGNGVNGHHGTNGTSRKRSYEEAATPVQEVQEPMWDDSDLELLNEIGVNVTPSMGFITPEFSQNGDGTISLGSDDVQRTKMQTGCIPCL